MPAPNRVPVERVRELLAKGCTPQQITARLGINKTSVSKVVADIRKEQAGV